MRVFTAPDLREIYEDHYATLPWPEPIPHPDQVIFRWKARLTASLGSCNYRTKSITISPLYQDSRLRGELEHLMAHEASHFIWHGHPKAFKDFLRRAGVAADYINSAGRPSETYRSIEEEWSLRSLALYPSLHIDSEGRERYAPPLRAPSG